MSIVAGLKIFSDYCFYFSIIAMLPGLFDITMPMLGPALLGGVSAGVAMWLFLKKNYGWRWLGLLLLLPSMLFGSSLIEWMVLAVPVLYTTVLIARGTFVVEYVSYREVFRISVKVWAILFFVVFLLGIMTEMVGNPMDLDYATMLKYGILYGVTGIFLLRQLRLGVHKGQTWINGGEMALLLGAAGVGGGLILGVGRMYRHVEDGLEWLFTNFFGLLWALPLKVVEEIAQQVDKLEAIGDVYETVEEGTQAADQIGQGSPPMMGPGGSVAESPAPFPWWLVVLILLVLVVFLYVMYRTMKKGVGSEARQVTYEKAADPRPMSERKRFSNGEKVRRCYREFLRLMRQRGVELRKDQTTEEILEAAQIKVDPEAAKALRAIYIRARYDETAMVAEEEVRLAKRALKEIKEKH